VRRLTCCIVALFALALPAASAGAPFLPPAGRVFAGVTGGSPGSFAAEVGKHAAVFQYFSAWNQPTQYMLDGAAAAHARLMVHISTVSGSREEITPKGIALGSGDGYLLRLNQAIAASGRVVYIRLMAEMDGHWNAYSAYNADGSSRGPDHSTAMFRQAWRRTVLIVRGGPVAQIDNRLRALGLPPVATGVQVLPRARVAFLWVPQVAGAPDTRANAPAAYWPGAAYVDWAGTDFYANAPNFSGLDSFYAGRAWRGKPFVFGEWALWGSDDPGFVRALFAWIHAHRRVRMVMYNQGNNSSGPFRLSRYPRGTQALRQALSSSVFASFAPEWARSPGH
jgi:hypothetical protein